MKIKCLRIHYEEEQPTYELYDRHGKFMKTINHPIKIVKPVKMTYFGFCNINSVDVTLEFETPIDSRNILDSSSKR